MKHSGLIYILKKQLHLYKNLYASAEKKMDIIKKGNIQALNQLMKDEQKLVSAIQMMENERQKELKRIYPGEENLPTIRECIEQAEPEEKPVLTELFNKLSDILQKTKERNDLNQQLIEHSLQFVNFSINLLQPKPESLTYKPVTGKPEKQETESPSVFNSQA